nr:hypothetical protein [Tanacetum cinerariifolium]
HFNAESDLVESLLNHDSSIIPSSSKTDSLLNEFASKLTLLKSILPGVDETDCYPENEIRFVERLLYDNSSPRPPKEFVSDNSNAETASFSPSPIPNEHSDPFMEEIDLFLTPDDLMPPSIEDDDDDSERDILIYEELLDNYSLSLHAQPALYNGHEILKDNHARAKVHNIEDTLEIVEITRKKMNAKIADPECVTHKVKIAPHDYSKENLLATFTPQKQLTPEQIYWSNDLMKLKSKALKERAKFLEFDKTCKKRITPSTITDGERGFEQTKACYLQEVIPFFQTIKDNFEVIQKALTREVKQMKDVFEELEAEVAQCAVDRKHDAIDRKNLLIANDNLITECLSKEVFSMATKSELNVARFAEMYVPNTSVEARCLALKAELATLCDKSHQENQWELIKHFYKLEDSIGNNPPTPEKDTPDFDSVFVIGKMQASLQGKDNVIRQLKKKLSEFQVTNSDTECTVKVRTTDSQLTKVTDPVNNLQAQNDRFRAENDKVKQHYKQLYDSIKITHAKHIEQVTKLTAENVTLKTSVSQAKESVETIRDIVEEAKVVRPLDRSIASACHYTQHSQELLEYSALCDNDKQHRKKIDEQEILFDKMSRQLVEMNNNVLRLLEKILEKEMKISELEGCISNKDVKIEKGLERLNE